MRVTRKFRGQSLLEVGTEERNVYINQMSPATEKWYNGTDEELYVNEDTGNFSCSATIMCARVILFALLQTLMSWMNSPKNILQTRHLWYCR